MKRVFADAFFFLAFLSERDHAHDDAISFMTEFQGGLITTEWVLTEVADGMSSEESRAGFVAFYESIRKDSLVQVFPATPESFAEGLALYSQRLDKDWSLTDCISFNLMRRQGVFEALTEDRHFRQAGFTPLFD
jgi:uncharacterized protein